MGTVVVVISAALTGCRRPRPGASTGTEAEAVEIVLPPAGGLEASRRLSGGVYGSQAALNLWSCVYCF